MYFDLEELDRGAVRRLGRRVLLRFLLARRGGLGHGLVEVRDARRERGLPGRS